MQPSSEATGRTCPQSAHRNRASQCLAVRQNTTDSASEILIRTRTSNKTLGEGDSNIQLIGSQRTSHRTGAARILDEINKQALLQLVRFAPQTPEGGRECTSSSNHLFSKAIFQGMFYSIKKLVNIGKSRIIKRCRRTKCSGTPPTRIRNRSVISIVDPFSATETEQ
jgi:hypothetical protein